MAQFPGLLLWTDAWVADTKHLTRLERGTYHDLLVLMWRTPGCRVPNDDAWLARHLAMTPVEIATELRPLIREFCQTDGNWIFQKRLQKEFVRTFKIAERMSVLRNRRKTKGNGADTSRTTLRPEHYRDLTNGESQRKRREKKEVADKEKTQPSAELIKLVTGKQPKEG